MSIDIQSVRPGAESGMGTAHRAVDDVRADGVASSETEAKIERAVRRCRWQVIVIIARDESDGDVIARVPNILVLQVFNGHPGVSCQQAFYCLL